MLPVSYTKIQIFLSVPGALMVLIGLVGVAEDTAIALLIMVWGAMLMPVFWVFLETKLERQFSFMYRVGLFFLAFVLVGLFVPTAPKPVDPLSAEGMTELIEETIATTPSSAPDIFSDETGELLVPEAAPETVSHEQGDFVSVVDVVDGDTLKVALGGRVETVRVIGIDTPETVHPNGIVECFGYEASAKARELLEGETVVLTTDPSQGERDTYDRYLAYITLPNGQDFGEAMLRGGYAYEYTYDGPYANQAAYRAAEVYASSNEQGLWADGACGGVRAYEPREETSVTPAPVLPAVSDSCAIKGNISYSSGEKIYHVPGQQNYDDTVINESYGERWFCSESEAVAAGWRKAKR